MWIGIRCSKGNEMRFANWVGTLIYDLKKKIILVTDEGKEAESVTRLARVGYDNACGYLKGGVKAYSDAGFELSRFGVAPIQDIFSETKDFTLVDVRNNKQWTELHINSSIHCPVRSLENELNSFAKDKDYVIYCNSGFQATIFISMLK